MPVKKTRHIIFNTFLYGQGFLRKENRQPELSNIEWQTVLESQRLYTFPESFDHIPWTIEPESFVLFQRLM